jgi:hypothetical protein
MFLRSLVALLAFAAVGWADDTGIKLPNVTAEVAPRPMPPNVTLKLTAEVYYVVESDAPVMILSSPQGIVNVSNDTGPIKLKGKFIDGDGKTETRTYKSKYVYTVEQASTGTVELLIFKVGEPDESKVKRVKLAVGDSPMPPGPNPPGPNPPGPAPVTSFHVVLVYESGSTLSAKQTGVLYSKAVADYLTSKTTPEGGLSGWRRYDRNVNTDSEQATMKALWDAVKPKVTAVPCLVVEVNGKADILPFPANEEEALAILKKAGG